MKVFLKRVVPERVRRSLRKAQAALLDVYAQRSWSQEGEDMILLRFFEGKTDGFYVDVGAHHPRRFSNTCALYRRGWSGINIDATPGLMRAFRRERPRDRNIEAAVSKDGQDLVLQQYEESALNRFQTSSARQLDATRFEAASKLTLKTRRLPELLDEFLPRGQQIDLLSVDVEGMDLDVLEGNDWTRYRPHCVLVELVVTTIREVQESALHRYLESLGYDLFAKTIYTLFYCDRRA